MTPASTKRAIAVLTGYATFGVAWSALFILSGQDPRAIPRGSFLVFSIVYGALFAMLGGYLAARLAGREETRHGWLVVATIVLASTLTALLLPAGGSRWPYVALAALVSLAALVPPYAGRRRPARPAGSARP